MKMDASWYLEAAHEWMLSFALRRGIKRDDLEWAEIMAALAKARIYLNEQADDLAS